MRFPTQDKNRPRTECKHCTRSGRWARPGECGSCFHDLHRPSRATRIECACGSRCNLGKQQCWTCEIGHKPFGKCTLCPNGTNARSTDGLCSYCRKAFNRKSQAKALTAVHLHEPQ